MTDAVKTDLGVSFVGTPRTRTRGRTTGGDEPASHTDIGTPHLGWRPPLTSPPVRATSLLPSVEPTPHDPFIEWVLRLAKLDPLGYRAKSLLRRLPACLRAIKAATPEEGREKLIRHGELLVPALSPADRRDRILS